MNPGAKLNNHKAITPNNQSSLKPPKTEGSSTNKQQKFNDVEIKALKSKPMIRPAPPISSKSSSSSTKIGSDIKPSVSITPVSSAETSTSSMSSSMKNKNAAGIEIIPLGDKLPPDDQKHRSPSKDIKRSLSEDDKRRLEKKKRKREHFETTESSSSGKNSDEKKFKHSSSSSSSSSKKINNVIDRLSSGSNNDSGIEIVPTSGSSSSSSKLKNLDSSSKSNLHR